MDSLLHYALQVANQRAQQEHSGVCVRARERACARVSNSLLCTARSGRMEASCTTLGCLVHSLPYREVLTVHPTVVAYGWGVR